MNQHPSTHPVTSSSPAPALAPQLSEGLAQARYAMAEIINCIDKGVSAEDLSIAFRELGVGCAQLADMAESTLDRHCTGCSARINRWDMLPFVGYQIDDVMVAELRNCTHCGTTLATVVPAEKEAEAILSALERYLVEGDVMGRVVELASREGRLCIDVHSRQARERSLRGVESLRFGLSSLLGGRAR
jgi:hypothetical protein